MNPSIPESATLKQPPWKVGELARNTGVSVRALHHYDEIGLLTPSLRTAAGHRLYSRPDIERLQQIQSLRSMGMSLDETKRLLDGAAATPLHVIRLHLARLREQIALQKRLVVRLGALEKYLEGSHVISLTQICNTIEDMMKIENYFTPEQLEVLEQRREALGEARMTSVSDDWNVLIPQVQSAIDNGIEPASEQGLELVRRWQSLVHEFTGGDPGLARAVKSIYDNERPVLEKQMQHVPTPEMFAWITKGSATHRA